MRHSVFGRKLGRTTAHREAMFRNMAVSLIQHGRIRTTLEKAKELRVFAERLVGLGKKDSLHARRLAFNRLRDRDAVQKLFQTIAPAFKDRQGGYTRILKLATRFGDAAQLAIIEYLNEALPSTKPVSETSDSSKTPKKKTAASGKVAAKKSDSKKVPANSKKEASGKGEVKEKESKKVAGEKKTKSEKVTTKSKKVDEKK